MSNKLFKSMSANEITRYTEQNKRRPHITIQGCWWRVQSGTVPSDDWSGWEDSHEAAIGSALRRAEKMGDGADQMELIKEILREDD